MHRLLMTALTCLALGGVQMDVVYAEKECDAKAWTKPPPEDMFLTGAILGSEYILPITTEMRRLAIEKLSDSSVYKVGTIELQSLGIKELPKGLDAFFVRGVAYNVMTGKLVITIVGDALHVHHGSLGRGHLPLRCEPLLLFLRHRPIDVFVSAVVAE